MCTLFANQESLQVAIAISILLAGHRRSHSKQSTYRLYPCGHRVWVGNHVTEEFILYTGQIAGVCLTHVALLLVSIIYSQGIPRELFYNLSDFSNTLSDHVHFFINTPTHESPADIVVNYSSEVLLR